MTGWLKGNGAFSRALCLTFSNLNTIRVDSDQEALSIWFFRQAKRDDHADLKGRKALEFTACISLVARSWYYCKTSFGSIQSYSLIEGDVVTLFPLHSTFQNAEVNVYRVGSLWSHFLFLFGARRGCVVVCFTQTEIKDPSAKKTHMDHCF